MARMETEQNAGLGKLEPCPACGGKVEITDGYVECPDVDCAVMGPNEDPYGAKWNAMCKDLRVGNHLLTQALDEVRAQREETFRANRVLRKQLGATEAEVSRLRKELASVLTRLGERQQMIDELARQEPVAWRRQAPLGEEFFYGRKLSQESIAAWRHRGHTVESLYAAPKPADMTPTDRIRTEFGIADGPGDPDCRDCTPDSNRRAVDALRQAAEQQVPHPLTQDPADTPAMVEADRLIREGWWPAGDHAYHDDTGRSPIFVGKSTADAMRALRGGK